MTYLCLSYSCHEAVLPNYRYNMQYLTSLTFPFIITQWTRVLDTPSSPWRNSHPNHTPPFRRTRPSLPSLSTYTYFPLLPTYSSPRPLSSQGRTWHLDAPTPFEKPIRRRKLRYARPTTRPALLILSTFSAKTHSSKEGDEQADIFRLFAGEVDGPEMRVMVKWCQICIVAGSLVDLCFTLLVSLLHLRCVQWFIDIFFPLWVYPKSYNSYLVFVWIWCCWH